MPDSQCTSLPTGELDEGLRLLARLSSSAGETAGEAASRKDTLNAVDLFEQAIAGMGCTREELLTLWAALECATRAAGKVAESHVMLQAPYAADGLR